MTDLTIETTPANDSADGLFGLIQAVVALIILWMVCVAIEQADQQRERAERLKAYRARRSWRAADRRPLSTYLLSPSAQRRATRAAGRGRAVVKPYRPLAQIFEDAVPDLSLIDDPATPDHLWSQAVKRLPVWPELLEALYRGERDAARAGGRRSPAETAEAQLAERFALTRERIHQICSEVRKAHRQTGETAWFEPMTLEGLGRPIA
jgi:hypothetical protein